MKAVIYAAGRAARLANSAGVPHKILLEFGGRTLLERHLAILSRLGCNAVHIVTGHAREAVAAHFDSLGQRFNLLVTELHNPDFLEGSILSMQVSRNVLAESRETTLLMDGDVLYDSRMLRALVDSPASTALLVDRNYSTQDDDPVLVPLRGGKPFDFCKKWSGKADAVGESVGFFKLGLDDLRLLVAELTAMQAAEWRSASYDDALRRLIQAGRFEAVDVTGLPWTEIDFPHDLDFARQTILPRLTD